MLHVDCICCTIPGPICRIVIFIPLPLQPEHERTAPCFPPALHWEWTKSKLVTRWILSNKRCKKGNAIKKWIYNNERLGIMNWWVYSFQRLMSNHVAMQTDHWNSIQGYYTQGHKQVLPRRQATTGQGIFSKFWRNFKIHPMVIHMIWFVSSKSPVSGHDF